MRGCGHGPVRVRCKIRTPYCIILSHCNIYFYFHFSLSKIRIKFKKFSLPSLYQLFSPWNANIIKINFFRKNKLKLKNWKNFYKINSNNYSNLIKSWSLNIGIKFNICSLFLLNFFAFKVCVLKEKTFKIDGQK